MTEPAGTNEPEQTADQTTPPGPVEPAVPVADEGAPEVVATVEDEPARAPDATEDTADSDTAAKPDPAAAPAPRSRIRTSSTGVLIAALLAVLGFTLVVQVRNNATDSAFTALREEDLLRLLFDINSRDDRLQQDIATLRVNRDRLANDDTSREQLLEAAKARADDLGILAGTLKAQGQGVTVRLQAGSKPISADLLVNAVYELRGAGAEAMQIEGAGGTVRIIASTSFVDSGGGVLIDGVTLRGPFVITAIGEPETLRDAMYIPTGVVDEVANDGGNVIVNELDEVLVSQVRPAPQLDNAQPVG